MDLNQVQQEVRSQTMKNSSKRCVTQRIQEFEEYFNAMIEQNEKGFPYPFDRDILVEKAKELDLPIPYYNENDEYVIDWNGFE